MPSTGQAPMSDEETTGDVDEKTTHTVHIDGEAHEIEPGALVIEACLDNDAYVPHFCWHPRMSAVGMCRQNDGLAG